MQMSQVKIKNAEHMNAAHSAYSNNHKGHTNTHTHTRRWSNISTQQQRKNSPMDLMCRTGFRTVPNQNIIKLEKVREALATEQS